MCGYSLNIVAYMEIHCKADFLREAASNAMQ